MNEDQQVSHIHTDREQRPRHTHTRQEQHPTPPNEHLPQTLNSARRWRDDGACLSQTQHTRCNYDVITRGVLELARLDLDGVEPGERVADRQVEAYLSHTEKGRDNLKGALQLLINRYGQIRFPHVHERVSTKSFVVLIIGNSESNHLGAQGTFNVARLDLDGVEPGERVADRQVGAYLWCASAL